MESVIFGISKGVDSILNNGFIYLGSTILEIIIVIWTLIKLSNIIIPNYDQICTEYSFNVIKCNSTSNWNVKLTKNSFLNVYRLNNNGSQLKYAYSLRYLWNLYVIYFIF